MVPLCTMWCIWRERNDRCFEDKLRSHEELLHLFFFTLFTWTAGWLAPRVISFFDFLFLLPSPLVPFVYSQYTNGCALLHFYILLTFQKKKKKKKEGSANRVLIRNLTFFFFIHIDYVNACLMVLFKCICLLALCL
jgi:hypothetical protein